MTSYEIAGRVSFGNMIGVEQFTMTRSRGIQPGTIQFVVPVVPDIPIGRAAPFLLSDGVNSITIKDCIVQSIDIDASEGERYVVTLLDSRWRWAYGQISGTYNIVRGGVILNSTKKKPKELAELCLKEMGETKFDLAQLPNDTYPEVTWDLENPAVALENLCNSLGCVVCVQLDGSVKVFKQGTGKALPTMKGSQITQSIKMVNAPDDIYISAEATRWEVSLKIHVPFGVERSKKSADKPVIEQLVAIDKLSYKPPNGWGTEDPLQFANVYAKQTPNATLREQQLERDRIRGLASESVWKMFGFKFPFKLPGLPFEVKDINQITFHTELLTETTVEYASPNQGTAYETRRQDPFVYGMFYDRKDTGKNNVDTFSHRWWENEKLVYKGGFNVDAERGIVIFSDPVYSYDNTPGAKEAFVVPNLYLRVAISIRDPKTGTYWRETWKEPTGWKNSTKPRWVKRADLRREIKINPETGKPFSDGGDNITTLEAELKKYAKYEKIKLDATNPSQGNYSGFIPIELDGTVEQVTYSINGSGETETTASYGFEHSLVVPSYDERRRIALLNQFAAKQAAIMNGNKEEKR